MDETTGDDAYMRKRAKAMADEFPPLEPDQVARLRRIIGYSDPPREGDAEVPAEPERP